MWIFLVNTRVKKTVSFVGLLTVYIMNRSVFCIGILTLGGIVMMFMTVDGGR